MKQEIFLIAGEPSGDLHGEKLIQALKKLNPDLRFTGIGGPKMRGKGLECLLPMEEFEVFGFLEIIKSLPRIYKQFQFVKNHILKKLPQVVVLIDYPGFNLRIAKALRKGGYKGKIVQYISPTVWAWGKSRISKMEESLDLLLTIFPFEKELFKNTSLKVQFVGHPLVETLLNHPYQDLPFPAHPHLLALFPGSRKKEVVENINKQLETANLLKKQKKELKIGISCLREEYTPLIEDAAQKYGFSKGKDAFIVPSHYTYELMRASRSALAKSGTVTLELALHRKPTVVVYEVSNFNRFIARYILRIKLKSFCIVNILAKRDIFPEFIEKKYSPCDLIDTLKQIDEEGALRKSCLEGLDEIKALLQDEKASQKAASAILELMNL